MDMLTAELALKKVLPRVLVDLVIAFAQEDVTPWDAYDLWVPSVVPEWDEYGNYGSFPMTSIELPGW